MFAADFVEHSGAFFAGFCHARRISQVVPLHAVPDEERVYDLRTVNGGPTRKSNVITESRSTRFPVFSDCPSECGRIQALNVQYLTNKLHDVPDLLDSYFSCASLDKGKGTTRQQCGEKNQ